MKIHASGEDYLEAVLILQKSRAWSAPLILPGTWAFQSRVSVMRWAFCGMAAF